jgi:hypothetical protein
MFVARFNNSTINRWCTLGHMICYVWNYPCVFWTCPSNLKVWFFSSKNISCSLIQLVFMICHNLELSVQSQNRLINNLRAFKFYTQNGYLKIGLCHQNVLKVIIFFTMCQVWLAHDFKGKVSRLGLGSKCQYEIVL